MTTTTASAPPVPDAAVPPHGRLRSSIGRRYGRLWARLPRELGYLALGAVIYLTLLRLVRVAIGGLLLGLVAVLVLGLLLLAGRYLGTFERTRLRWARTPAVAAPVWSRPWRGKTFVRGVGDLFSNAHSWLYGLHSFLLNPLLTVITTGIWVGWLATGLAFTLTAVLPPFVPTTVIDRGLHGPGALLFGDPTGAALPSAPVAEIGFTAVGLLLLALFPLVTRSATLAHWGLARLTLARFPSEDLRQDVARADAARTSAIAAEDTALRRLERDIHDGPQQRLLALQMELSTAERRVEQDGDATEPIATARRLAAETLDELRALAQGFAPPLLQDRGLSAALGALGRRGSLPVDTAIVLDGDLPDAVERSVYFVAAELVTNAIKHAGATRVRLEARTEEGALRLTVTDDGRGGAVPVPGHGLAGIADRLAGLGGSLGVDSPLGGPTVVRAEVPLP